MTCQGDLLTFSAIAALSSVLQSEYARYRISLGKSIGVFLLLVIHLYLYSKRFLFKNQLFLAKNKKIYQTLDIFLTDVVECKRKQVKRFHTLNK